MSFCIKKDLVFSLRKSNNTKYYRTENFGEVSASCLELVRSIMLTPTFITNKLFPFHLFSTPFLFSSRIQSSYVFQSLIVTRLLSAIL